MTQVKKRIILMRHADSLPAAEGGDINRKLSPKGVQQAENAASFLAKFDIDKLLVSPSTRTKQTMNIMLEKLNIASTEVIEELYKETDNKILDIISEQSSGIENLMILGHNPSICMLAFDIAQVSDKEYETLIRTLMPPACVVIIEIAGIESWSDLKNKNISNITNIFNPV